MAISLQRGPNNEPAQRFFSVKRDEDGHREYAIKFLVNSTTGYDGPATVLQCPGLPQPYSLWILQSGPDGSTDVDVYAWCKWDADVHAAEGQRPNEPIMRWEVDLVFTTKPPKRWCRTIQVQDPLLEPPKISGSFVKYTEEATKDKDGLPILNSAWEQIRGPQVEFDKNRPNVKIEMPVAQLQLPLVSSLIDNVNSVTMWGLPPRCVKLSNFEWERRYWGQCDEYFTWKLDFDIRNEVDPITGTKLGFDRLLLDEGTKVLNGHWGTDGHWHLDKIGGETPNPYNPTHFKRFQDRAGNVCRVILNGLGLPASITVGTGSPDIGTGTSFHGQTSAGYIFVQKYPGSDFSVLGIPMNFSF